MEGSGQKVKLPLLDGTNYGYWRAKVEYFIVYENSQVWSYIVKKGVHHVKPKDAKGKEKDTSSAEVEMILKPRDERNADKHKSATLNAKALFNIFSLVDSQEFKRISKCTDAYDAWHILHVAHEGTELVKDSKPQTITTKFENIKMRDDEIIKEFYAKLRDLPNQAFSLGKIFSDKKMVKKVLRMPKLFSMKVTTIEDGNDTKKMSLEQLFGNLETYEMSMLDEETWEKKPPTKNIALKAATIKPLSATGEMTQKDFQDHVVRLSRNFNKFLKNKPRRDWNGESS